MSFKRFGTPTPIIVTTTCDKCGQPKKTTKVVIDGKTLNLCAECKQ